jgi:hypothetical protein
LPGPDNEHVVAAAVVGGSGAIVTHNIRDFPSERLPLSLDVLSPAEFALDTVSIHPGLAFQAVREMAQRSGQQGSTLSVNDGCDILRYPYDMVDAIDFLFQAH